MGTMFEEDFGLSLRFCEEFENATHVGTGSAIGEFAVTEGAGAAFAEEVIAFGVQRAAAVEGLHILDAIFDGGTAFEHEWTIALLGEEVSGDQSGRAGADHNWALSDG
jgi:hypothetical protein